MVKTKSAVRFSRRPITNQALVSVTRDQYGRKDNIQKRHERAMISATYMKACLDAQEVHHNWIICRYHRDNELYKLKLYQTKRKRSGKHIGKGYRKYRTKNNKTSQNKNQELY